MAMIIRMLIVILSYLNLPAANGLVAVSPQGIAARVEQAGAATLRSGHDAILETCQFSSARVEGRRPGCTTLPTEEYRSAPLVPEEIIRQPDKHQFLPYFFLISFNSILLSSAIF